MDLSCQIQYKTISKILLFMYLFIIFYIHFYLFI